MYDINLIPESRYNNNTLAKTFVTITIGVMLMALLIYYGVIDPIRQQSQVEQIYRIHKSQMARLSTTAEEHAQLSATLEQLRIRKDGMSGLLKKDLPESLLIANIDGALPQGVRIFGITYGDNTVSLQGHALSLLNIADLSVELKNTGIFEIVRIISVERDLAAGYKTFVINLKLIGQ